MPTYIALLRGINVGTGRKVPMSDLRTILTDAGCDDITTYIQSGNAVFTHAGRSASKLEADLEQRIEAATGLDVAVMLRTPKELADIVDANPYLGTEPTQLHVAFLKDHPDPKRVDKMDVAKYAPEELVVAGREVYLHLPNGMGKAKLPQALNGLKTPATARNWKTVVKLVELAGEGRAECAP